MYNCVFPYFNVFCDFDILMSSYHILTPSVICYYFSFLFNASTTLFCTLKNLKNCSLQAFVSFVGEVPVASKHWQDDRFYGSHFLNGCNPDTMKRCTKLPYNFPVTQELIGNLLDKDDTLENALKVFSREGLKQIILNNTIYLRPEYHRARVIMYSAVKLKAVLLPISLVI